MVLIPAIVVQLLYLQWRFNESLIQFSWEIGPIWQQLFFYSELLVVIYVLAQCVMLLRARDRTEQCDELCEASKPKAWTVDLFIPTCSEPRQVLLQTIRAAKTDLYPNLDIWICDDGGRGWLQELCRTEHVNYLHRPLTDPVRTKAGNLRWCLSHGEGEVVVCLDADFQAQPQMTTRLVSFFSLDDVGLVQAPQHFRNLDPVQSNLQSKGAWTEEQRFFFDITLPSRDAWGNTLCVGSCWAARRCAIDQIGGFPADSIVEDVYFGYYVISQGWRTVYINEPVAYGLAAEDVPGYVLQRSRWCRGAISLLWLPSGPLRIRNLKLLDRLFYLELPLYWLTQIHLVALLFAPSLFGIFGLSAFQCSLDELFKIVIPKNILIAAIFFWISSGRCMPVITQVQRLLPIFSVMKSIVTGLIFPFNQEFKTTMKGIAYEKRTIHWGLAIPFLIIGLFTVVAVIVSHLQGFNRFEWSEHAAFNAVLSAYCMVTIFLCCIACVEKPQNKVDYIGVIPLEGRFIGSMKSILVRIFF